MVKGTVKWFNARKGFGFITPEAGEKDAFVHHTNIVKKADEFATLNEGQHVEFEIEDSPKGPQAVRVTVIE
nr:cold-shock protein [Candidatus Sigynarchaeota archaeon]